MKIAKFGHLSYLGNFRYWENFVLGNFRWETFVWANFVWATFVAPSFVFNLHSHKIRKLGLKKRFLLLQETDRFILMGLEEKFLANFIFILFFLWKKKFGMKRLFGCFQSYRTMTRIQSEKKKIKKN
jgi:hypothetical protein